MFIFYKTASAKKLILSTIEYIVFVLLLSVCFNQCDSNKVIMSNVVLNKTKNKISAEDLQKLNKEELISRIFQLEAHNTQLKNIIQKNVGNDNSEKNDVFKNRTFDFSKAHKRHILLKFYYLGWDYNGYTCQEDSTKTIEHYIFKALTKSCLIQSRQTCNYHRCGRTDKGVSAFSQVISLDIRSCLSPEDQNISEKNESELKYCHILNRLLPLEIRCVAWAPLKDQEYSARFNCKLRTYHYYFPRGKLNIESMRSACQYLIGCHDFRNLCKMDVANGVVDFKRSIKYADIISIDQQNSDCASGFDMFAFVITSKAFLWHQIRCIMAILLLVGNEYEEPKIIADMLDVDKNKCKPQYSLASDIPLNLFKTEYDLEDVRTYTNDPSNNDCESDQKNNLERDHKNNWYVDEENLKRVIEELQGQWFLQNIKATMMRNMLTVLQDLYNENSKKENILCQAECILQGVRSKTYKKLLERDTCESLESRIDHYVKKRRLNICEDNND